MGFGFAYMITGPIAAALIDSMSFPLTYHDPGTVYFFVMMASSQDLALPPANWTPEGFTDKAGNGQKKNRDLAQLTANEAIKTRRFWMLWLMMFINISCGIAILAVASPMAQEITGMTAIAAAAMVGTMGIFNGAGRLAWASFSDYIG